MSAVSPFLSDCLLLIIVKSGFFSINALVTVGFQLAESITAVVPVLSSRLTLAPAWMSASAHFSY